MKTSHKIARIALATFALLSIIHIATVGRVVDLGTVGDSAAMATMVAFATRRFRGIVSRGFRHLAIAFAH